MASKEASTIVPKIFFLLISINYRSLTPIRVICKTKSIQKLRNFLRSGGKKLRSWLYIMITKACIELSTHLSTFECATSCAVDQKVKNQKTVETIELCWASRLAGEPPTPGIVPMTEATLHTTTFAGGFAIALVS
ncbi:hypothetical protein [Pantoea sp. Cy-639]|uniref:hypothetical protein n=1 Tax=Pantoea sp. Cy-639 TaxID=2608360 RepID=UPI001423F408|nr:hypothetical protein [Pantoea sp. Cy-639]NIF19355.1 hypothetical protein [Pantoea sp. Cy-639]